MARLIAIDLGAHAVKVSVFQGTTSPEDLEMEVSHPVPQDGTELPGIADRLAVLDVLLREHSDWSGTSHLTGVAWPADLSTTQLTRELEAAVMEHPPAVINVLIVMASKGLWRKITRKVPSPASAAPISASIWVAMSAILNWMA